MQILRHFSLSIINALVQNAIKIDDSFPWPSLQVEFFVDKPAGHCVNLSVVPDRLCGGGAHATEEGWKASLHENDNGRREPMCQDVQGVTCEF